LEVKKMARITKEDVKHVAHLARLSFSDEEIETYTKQLDDIIGFAEQLNELDTNNVEPTTHVLDIKNVLREDESRDWLSREEALQNAPDQQNGQVKVPRILE
jgi:aspartyl-tRNA(Asn)/glutamyl-tRNA(Gln) amidotransferase subunit C